MASVSEIKQLKDYYEEKIEYLEYLIKNETYYCSDEKTYKHEIYKSEIKQLKESVSNIESELKPSKVERKYTPGNVKVKRTKVKSTRSRSKSKSRSMSPTLAEKNEDIRKNFTKILKSITKKSKTKVKKSVQKSKSRSRSSSSRK